jgi:hypothetical protein
MTTVKVNVDNFVRAETARMFDANLKVVGALNRWFHFRAPPAIDTQPVIRMNRDTLYSGALVDIRKGATVTLPEVSGRYMTMMIVNEDHYINRVVREPGTHELTVDGYDSPFVLLTTRLFVDPADADDIAAVNALQDAMTLEAASAGPYEHPDYDQESLKATHAAVAALGNGLDNTDRMFGKKEDTDAVRHLIGTASGWGGLPESEAYYILEMEPRPAGRFVMTVKDVPVDGFWSVTIYNRDGFLEENPYGSYSINNVTAVADEDGSVTLNLAPEGEGLTNHLYVMDGWNYALRLYWPRPSILDGTWSPPKPQPIDQEGG